MTVVHCDTCGAMIDGPTYRKKICFVNSRSTNMKASYMAPGDFCERCAVKEADANRSPRGRRPKKETSDGR